MILAGISLMLVIITLPFSLCYCVKVKLQIRIQGGLDTDQVFPRVESKSRSIMQETDQKLLKIVYISTLLSISIVYLNSYKKKLNLSNIITIITTCKIKYWEREK